MARSEDAIRRRAVKRQRTEEEQRQVDGKDIELASQRRRQRLGEGVAPTGNEKALKEQSPDPLQEIGAWKCPGCGNENFASRHWCNSKTCNERRPEHIPVPTGGSRRIPSKSQYASHPLDEEGAWICASCQYSNFASRDVCNGPSCDEQRPGGVRKSKPGQRHDPETSKPLVWSKQADPETLSKNQLLRQRYQETEGEGMSEDEINRAKILIERDQRKQQKKLEKKRQIDAEATQTEEDEVQPDAPVNVTLDVPIPTPSDVKAQKSRNKKLRKLFLATGGKGMTPDDLERAKILVARDERKRMKAALLKGTADGEKTLSQ